MLYKKLLMLFYFIFTLFHIKQNMQKLKKRAHTPVSQT